MKPKSNRYYAQLLAGTLFGLGLLCFWAKSIRHSTNNSALSIENPCLTFLMENLDNLMNKSYRRHWLIKTSALEYPNVRQYAIAPGNKYDYIEIVPSGSRIMVGSGTAWMRSYPLRNKTDARSIVNDVWNFFQEVVDDICLHSELMGSKHD